MEVSLVVSVIIKLLITIELWFVESAHFDNSIKPYVTQSCNQNEKVVIFSKSYCPYCTKAKKIFEN